MNDSAIIRTRTGRPILRFRADEEMIRAVYEGAGKLEITVSEFIRLALSHYLVDLREIRRRSASTRQRIMKEQGTWPEEEESRLRDEST